MTTRNVLAVLSLLLFSSLATAAVQERSESGRAEIAVSGTLGAADAAQLEALATAGKLKADTVLVLDGDGDDLDAAMRMGRAVRAAQMKAEVRAGAQCFNACVLLLAAAGSEQVAGRVGITRIAVAKEKEAALLNAARKYLAGLGVPVDLAHQMFSVPAGTPRLFNEQELGFYRLTSAVGKRFDEDDNAGMAKKMGLSLGQYLQFKELLLYKCDVYRDNVDERQRCLDTAYRNFMPVETPR
ncbi:MAG: hypothetical protein K0S16_1004 [Moraxellaceae bacterium]|nr:hypothetical protein [Moraxellaceae bacterium]